MVQGQVMSEAQAMAEEKVRAREESEWGNVLLFGYVWSES